MPGDTLGMRFSQCGMGASLLLIYEVYIVCSHPPERWSLPSVQWAPHPFREIMFTNPSVELAPHTHLSVEVYLVCIGPSSPLRDEVYLVRSGYLIPDSAWEMKFIQSGNQPTLQPLLLPEMKLTSVQPASHPS